MARLIVSRGPQTLFDFVASVPHCSSCMKTCIICQGKFEPNGNPNKNKQLTCTEHRCQRALKTIRQSVRREWTAKHPRKK